MRSIFTIVLLLLGFRTAYSSDGWVATGATSVIEQTAEDIGVIGPLPPLPDFTAQPALDPTTDEPDLIAPPGKTPIEQSVPDEGEVGLHVTEGATPDPPTPVIVEEGVDLRPPTTEDLEKALDESEQPTWLNSVIDDHSLLWREVRSDGLSILPASDFGLTSIGFDFGLSDGEGPVWTQLKFDWTFLNGPNGPHVRPQLYDISYEFNYSDQFANVGIHAQVAPTYSTDWDNKGKHAFRLIGGGLATLELAPGFDLVGGAMYLDRPDLNVLPIYGLRMHSAGHELDIVYPRFRYAVRVGQDADGSNWMFAKTEFGGGAWAIDSDGFGNDQMGYRDWRLTFGWESREPDGDRHVFEVGLVFDRELEFERQNRTLNLGNTALIRMGRTF